jgi:auxin efflux carrier family protein
MPIIQVLLIGVIGAYLASGFSNVLTTSARRDMNKVSSVIQFSTHLFFLSPKRMTKKEICCPCINSKETRAFHSFTKPNLS